MWKIERQEYKGKNCLGEKIYHRWFIKGKKINSVFIVTATKYEIWTGKKRILCGK